MGEFIVIFTIFAVTAVLFVPVFLLIRSGHRNKLYEQGNFVLRYGRWISGILFTFVFVASLIVASVRVLISTKDWLDRENVLTFLLVFVSASGILLFLFGPVIWATLRYRIAITDTGLDIRHHFSGKRFLKWVEIVQVSYKRGSNAFSIHCRDGTTLRISMMVMGLDSLLEAFEEHVALDALEKAKTGYRRIRREFPPY